ncbi:MAG: ABC transporter substrate-binding protein [Oligoflexia bacterium]|nr:ABC transporter substrate-binding protein [Oligoflexia bacterium]
MGLRIHVSLIALLVSASFILTGCTKKKDDTAYEGFAHIPLKANVKGFDPVISGDLYSGTVMDQIFDGLMQYSYLERPIKVEPLMAASMPTVSKDGLTYTFKIKPGILFHDDPSFKETAGKGREVTAEDFIYSWKRLADPTLRSDAFWIFDGKIKGMTQWRDDAAKAGTADYSKPVPGLSAPDKYTLKIQLEKPYPQILYVLTMVPTTVLPREAVEAYGKEFQNHPVGAGAYRFKSWTRNARIVLEKNPNYYEDYYPSKGEPEDEKEGRLADAGKRLPLNDGIVFTEIVEDQPRWLNFRKGIFDIAEIPKDNFDSSVQNGELNAEMKNQGVQLTKWVDPDVTYECFNIDDAIVGKNKFLRQAMALAIDVNELNVKFYKNAALPAQGPIPPGINGYDPELKNPYKVYDLAKAKELLKKAGYPEGKNLPEINYETYSGSTARQIAEYMQQSYAKIGVKLKINMNTWPEFLDKIKTRKAQMFGMAWSADYPDAENFLQLSYGRNASPGPNHSNYKNPEFDKLYEQSTVMQDTPARSKIYQKMVLLLNEDMPCIYNVHRKGFWLNHGWLKNFKHNLINLNYVKYFKIDKQAKAELKKKL